MKRIGLISDIHASPGPLKAAFKVFSGQNVDGVYCLGDIAGYFEQVEQVIDLLEINHCFCIKGNHDESFVADSNHSKTARNFLDRLPYFYDELIEGKRVLFVHAEPPQALHGGIKLLDKEGLVQQQVIDFWENKLDLLNYDVLVVGHTHQVFWHQIGKTLVINPGSTVFNNSCMILSLPSCEIELYALGGKAVKTTWNWGEQLSIHD